MSRLRIGQSLWLDGRIPGLPRLPSLRGSRTADVAIIGGGITGCAAAYLMAAAGARVVLLDAGRVGHGSTAASTALLMQEPDVDFSGLLERYGAPLARRMWRVSRHAVRDFARTLAALHVRADVRALPSVYYADNDAALTTLRLEHARRTRQGIASRWLSREDVRALTGLDSPGALLTRGDAESDPYRSCVGLLRAARRAGARAFERARVVRVDVHDDGVEVRTPRGRVSASWVVVATGYATPELRPLAGRFRMQQTYVIATPPLDARTRRATGLGDVVAWSTARPYHYFRWSPDGRLLFGGRDGPRLSPGRRPAALRHRARQLTSDLRALYPALHGVEPAYAWEGLFASTPDGLPYIGRHARYPRHLFALGYGGNGMTFGFLAAQILTRVVTGAERPDDTLFGFDR